MGFCCPKTNFPPLQTLTKPLFLLYIASFTIQTFFYCEYDNKHYCILLRIYQKYDCFIANFSIDLFKTELSMLLLPHFWL